VDIDLPVTGSCPTPLARDNFPTIAECVRTSAARPRIAPVHDEHAAVLERIAGIGVPR
jgi:hypothetical protein